MQEREELDKRAYVTVCQHQPFRTVVYTAELSCTTHSALLAALPLPPGAAEAVQSPVSDNSFCLTS
jgi:hypothetical protein